MAAPLPLEGDVLVENLFHFLWTTDDLGAGPRVSVPPTVLFRAGQPTAWYFTSRRSGRIKRKHRTNLTPTHIEHSFTRRKAPTDIVAYYLYLPHAESSSAAIEYLDPEALREFLFKRPEIPSSSASPGTFTQGSGILQQFALPKGARNATLRAIWSPKLCLLERRVNLRGLHDARYSVYERGVTFEEGGGAEALSRAEPVRGAMLPGMVQQLCEQVVDHVTRVSYHKFRIARMVLRLQVDADDRLWLLWCSSLRLQPPLAAAISTMSPGITPVEASIRPLDIVGDVKVPNFAFEQGAGGGPVSLSAASSSNSSDVHHDDEPRPGQGRCASCARVVARRALLPTTYKAVLAHFQHVLKFLRERVNEKEGVAIEWPPDERVIQQAGGVGFGILRHVELSAIAGNDEVDGSKSLATRKMWSGRELLVPPVIRYLHPTLRAEDFARHRQDPIFLHKVVAVCERCCLVYADYATAALEANGLGISGSASAPALLRPPRERPERLDALIDSEPTDSLLLTTTNHHSPPSRSIRATASRVKPPASAWQPMPTDEQRRRRMKLKTGPRSTLVSLPVAPKLPPRIEGFEPEDQDALRLPDGLNGGRHDQQREEAFFRELYQQKDAPKRGGHALQHMLEAADRLSKARPQHRLAALADGDAIGQTRSTGALADAITELNLARKPGKSPYSVVQKLRSPHCGDGVVFKSPGKGKTSPDKSPQKRETKQTEQKKRKKGKPRDEAKGGAKAARFVSSREKRAAAAHRDFLVAALSDAQVQLEHIESLATLVTSTRGPEADEDTEEEESDPEGGRSEEEPEQHDEQEQERRADILKLSLDQHDEGQNLEHDHKGEEEQDQPGEDPEHDHEDEMQVGALQEQTSEETERKDGEEATEDQLAQGGHEQQSYRDQQEDEHVLQEVEQLDETQQQPLHDPEEFPQGAQPGLEMENATQDQDGIHIHGLDCEPQDLQQCIPEGEAFAQAPQEWSDPLEQHQPQQQADEEQKLVNTQPVPLEEDSVVLEQETHVVRDAEFLLAQAQELLTNEASSDSGDLAADGNDSQELQDAQQHASAGEVDAEIDLAAEASALELPELQEHRNTTDNN